MEVVLLLLPQFPSSSHRKEAGRSIVGAHEGLRHLHHHGHPHHHGHSHHHGRPPGFGEMLGQRGLFIELPGAARSQPINANN